MSDKDSLIPYGFTWFHMLLAMSLLKPCITDCFFGVSNFSLYNLKKLWCCGRWWNLEDFVLHATIRWGTIVDNARGGYTIQIGFYSLSCHRLNHNPDWGVFLITNSFWQGLGQDFVQDCSDFLISDLTCTPGQCLLKNCH